MIHGTDDDVREIGINGRTFSGIRRLGFTKSGCFVIDLHSFKPPMPRGGYFTTVPISERDYRATFPTKAAFVRDGLTSLKLYDDYGYPHRINAPSKVIDELYAECIRQDLPIATFLEPRK